MGLSLREYADSLNVSYEAIRSSFNHHVKRGDLQEGLHFQNKENGRGKILTEAGIEAMNAYRPKLKKLPPAINPADISEYQRQIIELQDQIKAAEDAAAALKAENADLRLQIADLTNRLQERSDALITALFHVQNLQERLLPAAEEPKRGIFSRIFKKREKV